MGVLRPKFPQNGDDSMMLTIFNVSPKIETPASIRELWCEAQESALLSVWRNAHHGVTSQPAKPVLSNVLSRRNLDRFLKLPEMPTGVTDVVISTWL